MPAEETHQRFVELLDAFVAGRDRTREHVAAMESEFAKHFDDDPRFANLQYELAMLGADDHPGDAGLASACASALALLRGERRAT